ncbi:hypothetical protein U8C35_27255 (plasmid) [Sinorhizobium medicae]|uniref:hypothetical protein n=1 Tax=Sinorhizobium medicae TaxID=110321 RepID=UPI002AF6A527|nr:hypothetical protein [Sinorhizobium medicae]WQO61958.1 hypothetical protein U8C35_27255 [Sinorhizobium medicae]
MSGSPSSIYRVRQLVDHDGATVTEVAEEAESNTGYAHPKEVHNAKVRLGGIDSFWLATNVKSGKFSSPKPTVPALFPSTSSTSSLIGRAKGASRLDVASPFSNIARGTKIEGITFGNAIRVPIAIGPGSGGHERLITDLTEGKLAVDIRNTVDAIEVRPGVYMISGFVRNSNGYYGLAPDTRLRAVPTVQVTGNVGTTRLSSGLLVFGAEVKWTEPVPMDLRSEAEILASAESWLARIKKAASHSTTDGSRDVAEIFRGVVAAAVSAEERYDLESAVSVLSGRQDLLDILPDMLARHEPWQSRMRKFEAEEHDRLRSDIKAKLAVAAEEESQRIAELRQQIIDAEGRLAVISHREVLVRNETEKHDELLKEKIAEAARTVASSSVDVTQKLREEVEQLKDELSKVLASHLVEDGPSSEPHAPIEEVVTARPDAEALPKATDEQCSTVIQRLRDATGLTEGRLFALLLQSTEGVPVLVGDGSTGIAAEIVSAVGGKSAAVLFCDPTRISFADLVGDERSGFARSIEIANANPEMLVPVALCGLTNGPCEYWLPQLVEMRRIGRLPPNLALIASAGVDGLRVSVPKSVMRYLFPLSVSRRDLTDTVEYAGSWLRFTPDAARIHDAIKVLRAKSVEPVLIGRLADILSRAPVTADLTEVASILVGEQRWTAAWRDGADHELIQYFQNLEN